MTTAQVLKKVKAINERLALYEEKGLTDSATYQGIQDALRILGVPTTLSKPTKRNPTVAQRLSRSKEAIQYLSTEEGQKALERIDKKGGLKQEIARTKKRLKEATGSKKAPSAIEVHEAIKAYGMLDKWLEENLSDLYDYAQVEDTEEATNNLLNMLDDGGRYYTYEEFFAAIKAFEEAKAKYLEKMKNSDLQKVTETVILQGKGSEYDSNTAEYKAKHKEP